MKYPYEFVDNDPRKAGALAGRKLLFGDYHRFAFAPVHTRFHKLAWFVWDAERTDDATGLPAIVRIENSFDEAVAGLEVS